MERAPIDMLHDVESELQNELASTGQRLANYLIDLLSFYLVLVVIVTIITLPMESEVLLDTLENMPFLMAQLFGVFLYGLYMAVIEGALKGKTLGKLFTSTKAVHESGVPLTWRDAFWRGLVRMVPFEYFSALSGLPWHDRWTRTRVIKIRK